MTRNRLPRAPLPHLAFCFGLGVGLTACTADFYTGTSIEPERAADREHVKTEYGEASPVPVNVQVNGQPYQFLVRVSANHPRILVEPTRDADQATAGAASRYSMGLIQRDRDLAPYQEAGLQHLQAIGRKECRIRSSAQFNKIGVELNYECANIVPPKAN